MTEFRARHGNVEQLVEAVAIRAELAETAVAGQVGDPLPDPGGIGTEGPGKVVDPLERDRASPPSCSGGGRRRSRRGGAEHADRGLADHVVEGDSGAIHREPAEQRAERQRRSVARIRRLIQGLGDQLRAAQRRGPRGLVREGRVERVAPCARAFIAVARSCGSGALVIVSA